MKPNPFGVLFLLLLIISTSASCQRRNAGVYQLIERTSGRAVCWGLIIQLHELTFEDSISRSQIRVVEAKHNRDLMDLMELVLDHRHKMLTLKFNQGKGGFGSGDDVEITINGTAFIGAPQQTFMWSISTDPM